jgi:hypothetical protein
MRRVVMRVASMLHCCQAMLHQGAKEGLSFNLKLFSFRIAVWSCVYVDAIYEIANFSALSLVFDLV